MKTIASICMLLLVQGLMAQVPHQGVRSSDPILRRVAHLEELVRDLNQDLEVFLERQDSVLQHAQAEKFFVSLGLGLQSYTQRPSIYYVSKQNKLAAYETSSGWDLAMNAMLGYQFRKHHGVFFNVPLFTFSNKAGRAVGLFGQSHAFGMGYSYSWKTCLLFASINVEPYQKPIHALVQDRVFYQEPYSRVLASDLPNYTVYSPGLSFGAAYQLWAKRP